MELILQSFPRKRSWKVTVFETSHVWKCLCIISTLEWESGYRITGWKWFSLGILKALLLCSLASHLAIETLMPPKVFSSSLERFEIFPFSQMFWHFTLMHLGTGSLFIHCVEWTQCNGLFQSENTFPSVLRNYHLYSFFKCIFLFSSSPPHHFLLSPFHPF